MGPLTVIGHQHQTGGVDIEAASRMQLVRNRFVEIEHRRVIGSSVEQTQPSGLLSMK